MTRSITTNTRPDASDVRDQPGTRAVAPSPLKYHVATRTVVGREGTPVTVKIETIGPVTGVPVTFLHGLVGLNDHWESVVARISSTCRCTLLELPLLDLRGDDCSVDGAVDLTARFLETHGPSVLVGNSFGGHVAARIAIERHDLVKGLVLTGASGMIEKTLMSDVQIRPSLEWLERKIGELFFDKSKMNPMDITRAFEELSHRDHARAMVRLSRTARKDHLGATAGNIVCPTLLVWGREDVVTPPEACEQFHAKIPGSSVVWLDRCGHAPMIEHPDLFSDAMLRFVAGINGINGINGITS